MLCMTLIFRNTFNIVLWPSIWSILVSIIFIFEKNIVFCCYWLLYCINISKVNLMKMFNLLLLFFNLLIQSITWRLMLKSPTVTVDFSSFSFIFANVLIYVFENIAIMCYWPNYIVIIIIITIVKVAIVVCRCYYILTPNNNVM